MYGLRNVSHWSHFVQRIYAINVPFHSVCLCSCFWMVSLGFWLVSGSLIDWMPLTKQISHEDHSSPSTKRYYLWYLYQHLQKDVFLIGFEYLKASKKHPFEGLASALVTRRLPLPNVCSAFPVSTFPAPQAAVFGCGGSRWEGGGDPPWRNKRELSNLLGSWNKT